MGDADETLDHLTQDYVRRLRAGESVELSEYTEAHPALAERIEELFPLLAMMEGLKAPAETLAGELEVSIESPPQGAPYPEKIGPYVVARELGRGGMGRVYEVADVLGRRLAVKVVHPHLLERPGFLARFLREVETGLRVEHPGVVQTLSSGVAEYEGAEAPYVVLEYVEGTSLRDLLEETGGFSERLTREIGVAVAEALHAIHEAGVVHRDVKPENVVIAPDETVKLMDLGIALVQEDALRLTQTGEFVGSLLYAAPEQFRTGNIDARSDQYALGLLLFEIMVGAHPFSKGTGDLLRQRFEGEGAPPLRRVLPHATRFLQELIAVLLARDPTDRFDSAESVARILREGESSDWWTQQTGSRRVAEFPTVGDAGPAFVGRDEELERFSAAYASAATGKGSALLIVGEEGMGKSRLVSTWVQALSQQQATPDVLWLEHGPGAGMLGLASLALALRRLLGDGLEETVLRAFGEQQEAAATLLRHMQAPERAADVASINRASLESLYRTLLRTFGEDKPLVVVAEDLHFASQELRAWLDRLLPALREDRVLVLITTRPGAAGDSQAGLLSGPNVEELRLKPLPPEDGVRLFLDALGSEVSGLAASQEVVRRADGSPFCLIEFAEELRSQALRMANEGGGLPTIPTSVQRLVEERLAVLSPEQRDLLSVAACCGDRFDPVLVCVAAGVPRIAGLRLLHAADREYRIIGAEGSTYRFRHHLVQEGLHRELPPALRAAYHTSLAAALESTLDAEADPSPAACHEISRHYLLGDEPQRSERFVARGLDYLLHHAELGRADRMAQRALEALPDASPTLRSRLYDARARALDGRVDPAEVLALARKSLAAAEEGDDERRIAHAIRGVGASLARAGRHDLSWPYAERSVEVAERLGDPGLLAMTLDDLASCRFDMGRFEEARKAGERAILLAREAGDVLQAGRIMMTMAGYEAEAGRLEDARERAEFALTTSHLHGDRDTERFALGVLARMAHLQCDFRGAADLCARMEAMGREDGNLRMVASSRLSLAAIELNRGHPDRARELAELCGSFLRELGYREMETLLLVPEMLLESLSGRLGRALDLGVSALAALEDVPLVAIGARIHPRVSVQLAWTGAFEEAEAHTRLAKEKAEAAGVAREQLTAEQASANLLDAQGDVEGAADAYAALLARARQGELALHIALIAVRAGGLAVLVGREEQAREALAVALDIAEPTGFKSVASEARVWSDLLPGGNPAAARVRLERDAGLIPALARLRQLRRLSGLVSDDEVTGTAEALARDLLESVDAECQARMRRRVPLFGSCDAGHASA